MGYAPNPKDSGGALRHLNRLLSEDHGGGRSQQHQHQRQASDATFLSDALAPFTDTLFYDWDLGRVMDADELDYQAAADQDRRKSSTYGDGLAIGEDDEDEAGGFFGGMSSLCMPFACPSLVFQLFCACIVIPA